MPDPTWIETCSDCGGRMHVNQLGQSVHRCPPSESASLGDSNE